MNAKYFKKALAAILILMVILFVLFFIGDVIIGGKGAILCSIFFGCALVILGLFYILAIILLKKFGTTISAKVLSYDGIRNNPFADRCNITYNINGKNYTNWVICKSKPSGVVNEADEISILVLKKYPKIVINKYQNNSFMIVVMLILLIVGFFAIFSATY